MYNLQLGRKALNTIWKTIKNRRGDLKKISKGEIKD